jgi:hypothetical protein
VDLRRQFDRASSDLFAAKGMGSGTLNQESFHRMISLERRRTQRSGKFFLLMLLEVGEHATSRKTRASFSKIISALTAITRETDVTGWYKENSIVGVMFTEISFEDRHSIPSTLMRRVSDTLRNHLTAQQFHQISVSFHLLPEARVQEFAAQPGAATLYPSVAAADAVGNSSL